MQTRKLVYSFAIVLSIATALAIECPNGWVTFNDNCYLFSDDKQNWFHAARICREHEATLVTIDDVAEDNFLKQNINRIHHADNQDTVGYWSGANDLDSEGQWVWGYPSTQAVTFTDWHDGEPNNSWYDHREEDCVVLWGHSGYGYKWNDQPCDLVEHYICELGSIVPVAVG